jgi:DNA-binding CsgD family transcriptional regulator
MGDVSALDALLCSVAAASTTTDLLLRVVDHAPRALEADMSGLYLLDEQSGRPTEIFAPGLPDAFLVQYEQLARHEDCVFRGAMRARRPVHDQMAYTPDAWRRTTQYRAFAARYGIRHYMCAPICDGARVLGTLNLSRASDGAPFAAENIDCAIRLARAVGARLRTIAHAGPAPVGRLRAERIALRVDAPALERDAAGLGDDDTRALWQAVARGELVPLDTFAAGGRRFLVLRERLGPPAAALDARERDVIRRVAGGATNKSIAYDLGVSNTAVAKLLARAMRKLGVPTRVEIASAARRAGLLEGSS